METSVNNYNFQECQQLLFPEMLTIITCQNPPNMFSLEMLAFQFPETLATEILNMISEMLAIIVSRNVGNYLFPKYWQL